MYFFNFSSTPNLVIQFFIFFIYSLCIFSVITVHMSMDQTMSMTKKGIVP